MPERAKRRGQHERILLLVFGPKVRPARASSRERSSLDEYDQCLAKQSVRLLLQLEELRFMQTAAGRVGAVPGPR